MNLFRQNNVNQSNATTNTSSYQTQNISKTSNTQSSNATNTSTYEKGTILKGEITDIRYNEIDIKLDNNTTLTARSTNSSELAIGQTASFKVIDSSLTKLSLEVMADNRIGFQDVTINKALEEAGLPKNDKNKEIVNELLNNKMSIDKQSILTVLKQSYLSRDTSISTIILMDKHGIPFTEGNARQFEQYKNFENSIINHVKTLASDIPNLLAKASNTSSFQSLTNLNSELLTLLTAQSSDTEVINQDSLNKNMDGLNPSQLSSKDNFIANTASILNEQELQTISDAIFKASNFTSSSNTLTTTLLSLTQRQELIQVLDSFSLTPEMKSEILNGTKEFRELANFIQNSNSNEIESDILNFMKANGDTNAETSPIDKNAILKNPLIVSILESVSYAQKENNELASILPFNAREKLLTNLDTLQLPNEVKQKIQNGTITANELLKNIKEYLPLSDEKSVRELLSSDEYKKILKEEFTSKWSLTPQELAKEGTVTKLYQTLDNHLGELSKLLGNTQNDFANSNTLNSVSHLQENIDFMKTFNQLFTYVQLPLKLKEQNVHSDLYVYTNKKQLQRNKDNISVLLHLDMEHLGPLDIHIALTHKQITSKFYLSDELTKELTSANIDKLVSALKNKGFSLNYELLKREKDIDIVQDFMEKDIPAGSLKRYSFDIRA